MSEVVDGELGELVVGQGADSPEELGSGRDLSEPVLDAHRST
jgi:hypothetical protein